MKSARAILPVIPSLLDRLIDADPDSDSDPIIPSGKQLSEIKDNVRRDLENLLNTRLRKPVNLQRYPELVSSVVNYGLPDFSHIAIESENEQVDFANTIAVIIERYEPRFSQVQVNIRPIGDGLQRALHVKISAILLVEPDPIPVIFDSRLKYIDKRLTLRELKHG